MAAPGRNQVRTVLACTCALMALATTVACASGRSSRNDDARPQDTSDDGSTVTTRAGFQAPQVIPDSEQAGFVAQDGTAIVGQLFGSGKGPAVVLLHASRSDMRAWYALAQRLAGEDIVVLALDFRGYGQSQGEQDPANYPADVAGGVKFLKALGNKTVAIIGAEVGGTAAVKFAADQPGDLKALAVLGSGATFGPLDATEAAGRIKLQSLVYSAGDDGADDLAGLIANAELRRTPLPADPGDAAIQDALVRFVNSATDA